MTNKPNLQTNIYTGYIEEVIYKDEAPTLSVRIRIPSIHGTGSRGLKTEQLPIAQPLLIPGIEVNPTVLLDHLSTTKKVMTMLESGNASSVLYFGLRATPQITTLNTRNTQVLRYDDLFLNPPDPLREDVIYWDRTTDMLYFVDNNELVPFFDSIATQGDTLVGVLKAATSLDLSDSPYNTQRVVDGYPCQNGDYALSLNTFVARRIYMWSDSQSQWVSTTVPEVNQVYHILHGNTHGGQMLKIKTSSPYYTVVKASEYQRWVV